MGVTAAWALAAAGHLRRAIAAVEPGRAIAVLQPEIGEPFRSVFTQIVDGIEARTQAPVPVFPIGPNSATEQLAGELRRRDTRVLIALGRQGLRAATAVDGGLAIVAGCVLSVPESEVRGYSVYTLAPDPALLFAHLRDLLPAVRKISVVYDPHQNDWLVRRAREAAHAQGLELVALEARDLPAALRLYPPLLTTADPAHDAVWLPQDSTTVEDSAVLPLVLKEAWNRGFPVFSSNLSHVKRGALFALYPDNGELGGTLADAALRRLAGAKAADGVLPLQDVRAAINTRTAQHLGIVLGPRLASYGLAFPEP